MYVIWILVAMPVVALLCAACIVVSDRKTRTSNANVHGKESATGVAYLPTPLDRCKSISENKGEILVAILNGADNGQTRLSIRQVDPQAHRDGTGSASNVLTKIGDEARRSYKRTVWSLRSARSDR